MNTGDAPDRPRHKLSSQAQPFVPTFLRNPPSGHNTAEAGGPAPSQSQPPIPINTDPPVQPSSSRDGGPPEENANTNHRRCENYRGGGRGNRGGRRRSQQQQQQQRQASDREATERAAASMLTKAAFHSLLTGMSDDDVDMLMQSMPSEVQQLYDTHVTHYLRAKQGGRSDPQQGNRGPAAGQSAIMAAALVTFGDLTQEQLASLENALWQMAEEDEISAYRARQGGGGREALHEANDDGAGGGVFLSTGAEGLNSDEEEWLLEQIMATDGAATAHSGAAPPRQSDC